MNSCTIIGNLGADPVLRSTASARSVTNFTVAVDRRYQKTGDAEERRTVKTTDWIDVVVWNGLAEVCSQYLQKGSKVAVEGRIQTRYYQDRAGNQHKTFEINADKVHFLGNIRSADSTATAPEDTQEQATSA